MNKGAIDDVMHHKSIKLFKGSTHKSVSKGKLQDLVM